MMSDILLMCCPEAQLHTSVCSCKLNCLIKAQRSMSYSILFTRLVKLAGPTGSYETAYCHLCLQQSSKIICSVLFIWHTAFRLSFRTWRIFILRWWTGWSWGMIASYLHEILSKSLSNIVLHFSERNISSAWNYGNLTLVALCARYRKNMQIITVHIGHLIFCCILFHYCRSQVLKTW